MEMFEALVLGAVQGITEFLPVSSSGHLVLGEHFLGLEVEGLKSFDVVVHMGTLLAILVYFWRDIWGLLKALFVKDEVYRPMIGWIIIGTLPAVAVGLLAEEWIDGIFRNVNAVAIVMMIVSAVFVLGEYVHKKEKKRRLNWWKALVIGCAQAVALIPGVSRSGSTIVAGLFNGIEREQAARFSFLLGAPAIFGAGLLTAIKSWDGGLGVSVEALSVGFVSSFLLGLLSVWGLMKFLKKHTLVVFAVYLAVLGVSVLVF